MCGIVPTERCSVFHLKFIHKVLSRSISTVCTVSKTNRQVTSFECQAGIVTSLKNQLWRFQYSVTQIRIVQWIFIYSRKTIVIHCNDIVGSFSCGFPSCRSIAVTEQRASCIKQSTSTDSKSCSFGYTTGFTKEIIVA